jgi:hypothetical protein
MQRSTPPPRTARPVTWTGAAATALLCVACAGLRPGANDPRPDTTWRVDAQAPAAWGTPAVVERPTDAACAVIWEARWPVDGPDHAPAQLRLWSYAATQPADPEDDPFGLTAAEKAAAIAALQRAWDQRAAGHLLRPPGAFGPEVAVRGLFWGQEGTFTLAHSWSYLEAEAGALRGLRVLGTEGQDDGLAPDLRVWLGRPGDRLVVELRVPLPQGPLATHQEKGPDGIADGSAALRRLDAERSGPLGQRLDEADALLRTLAVRQR